jgi:hypothetical protein
VGEPTESPPGVQDPRLARWVAAGLITRDQAEAILAFESHEAKGRRGIPPVAEALGYLGAAMAVAAGVAFLGQSWSDLSAAGRGAILGGFTFIFFAGGWAVRRHPDPAVKRLTSALWALSVASGWGFLWVLMPVPSHGESDPRALEAGLGSSAYAAALWIRRRTTFQLIALFLAIVSVGVGAVVAGYENQEAPTYAVGSVVWILGALLLLLSWRGLARPVGPGYTLGGVAALYAPLLTGEHRAAAIVGLATAAALMAASVFLRRTVLLGLGVFGVFFYGIQTVLRYFGDTLGAPVALLIGGVALIAVAVLTVRLIPRTSHRPREPDSV